MIEKERIEAVKRSVDLVALVKSRGIDLKKNGKGYNGHCPFHEDHKSPSLSVTPEKNLWQCFGCNTGGDAIRFVELFDKVDFKEAVQILSADIPKKKTPAKQPAPTPALTVKDKKLLARVVAYYQHSFTEDPRGLEYLNNRGIIDNQAIKDFAVGFVTGTLKEILPDDEEIIKILQKIGILNKKGNECFYNSVVFPLFDENGAIVSLYGRNISDDNGVDHLYLSGPRHGLINHATSVTKRSSTIILTESIIDALTLYGQGFKNVIPAYGVNGLTEDHLLFFNRQIKEIYLAFDADEAGKEGAARVTAQLKEKDIVSHVVNLPDKDINIYFQRHTPEEFEQLLKSANPQSLETSDKINKRQQSLYREEEHGFTVGYVDRQYQIKGIQRGDTQLKTTIKASKDITDSTKNFELTTIDLYSSRSRQWFAKLCADLLEAAEELIKDGLRARASAATRLPLPVLAVRLYRIKETASVRGQAAHRPNLHPPPTGLARAPQCPHLYRSPQTPSRGVHGMWLSYFLQAMGGGCASDAAPIGRIKCIIFNAGQARYGLRPRRIKT